MHIRAWLSVAIIGLALLHMGAANAATPILQADYEEEVDQREANARDQSATEQDPTDAGTGQKSSHQESNEDDASQSSEKASEEEFDPVINRFGPYVAISARDTSAQWVMAIAAVIATSLSIVAVYLLKMTLDATKETLRQAIEATNATNKMAELAHKDFVATHRPHLRLRFISQYDFTPGQPPSVHLTFGNIGETPATIDAIGCNMAIRTKGDWADGIPNYSFRPLLDPSRKPIVIQPGSRRKIQWSATEDISEQDYLLIDQGKYVLGLIGQVRYKDDIGAMRHTGFFRVYEPSSKEFVAVAYNSEHGGYVKAGGTEHEYEE